MVHLIKKPLVIVLLTVIIGGSIGGFIYLRRGAALQYDFIIAQRGNLIQEVSLTGRVKAAESVALAFEKTGKVAQVFVKVGDTVSQGMMLIRLDNTELLAQLAQAEANVKIQEAKLEELEGGVRPEDIQVKETELRKAEQDLIHDYDDVTRTLHDVYTTADDAVRVKTVGIFIGYKTSSYSLTFTACDGQVGSDAEAQRFSSELTLETWQDELDNVTETSSRTELGRALENAVDYLTVFRDFLERTNDNLVAGCVLNDSSLDTYRTNVSKARTNVSTAVSDVQTLEQKITSQKLTVQKISDELNLKLAGTASEQIVAQEALVEQARAQAQSYQVQIAKTILRASLNGIITKQDAKIGEVVPANTSLVSIISEADFQIEVNVPEVDIAKVEIGDMARVTLDAYGDDIVFEAQVSFLDPAETILEGAATYGMTLQFIQKDARIKSGMTANIDVLTDMRENSINIPRRAVITRNGNKVVRILREGERVEEVRVRTGLRGSDGNIEIIEGVQEGDKVIIFINE